MHRLSQPLPRFLIQVRSWFKEAQTGRYPSSAHSPMSQPVEAIERTPEYEEFMRQLREFHERKGTTLQAEPVLGGKKLDLLKIYKTVMEAGGYEKVTQNRGWKQVGDPFDFPPTCTNSAYILKAVYTKNLLGWEEETYWKRTWEPPREHLEQSQKGHGRTSSPAPLAMRPRDRQTATAFTQQARPSVQQQPNHMQQQMPAMPNGAFYPPLLFVDEEFRTRIQLALRSTLPNEIDWAFNTLVKFSYSADTFNIDYMPALLDHLIEFALPFFENHVKPILSNAEQPSGEDMFCSKKSQEMLERVLQVFHIIRNFSFVEVNIRRLAHHETLRHLLMMGLALPPDSQYAELSRHCLDIMENIAPQILVANPSDPYLMAMTWLLYTNDRALILGAIRALTRVAVTEVNERVLGVGDKQILDRMIQFLLVDDEELVAATLEYFYQCSSLRGNFSTELVNSYPGNLIGLLTGYLSYKSKLAPQSSTLNSTIHSLPAALLAKSKTQAPPVIPDLTDYMHLDEPYRCLGWIKEKLASATIDDSIPLKELFTTYRELFGKDKPLGIKEFYTVLKIAFPQPQSVEKSVQQNTCPMDELILRNIKYAPKKLPERIKCHWTDCKETFENDAELHRHIVSTHLEPTKENNEEQYTCRWMSCDRNGFKQKNTIINHLRTHFAGKTRKQQRSRKDDFAIAKIPVDDSEVSGVPLTAALLLRNLARFKEHHPLYLPHESELMALAIQRPKLSKYILTVLADIRVD